MEINLSQFLSDELNVQLQDGFRKKLFQTARENRGSWFTLAACLDVQPFTIRRWRKEETLPKLGYLYDVAKIAGISEKTLFENIVSMTAKRKSHRIPFLKKLTIDEEVCEWFGLLNGDGSIRKDLYDVAFSNKKVRLHQFFIRILQDRFLYPGNLFYLSLRTPKSSAVNTSQLKDFWSQKLCLKPEQVRVYSKPTGGIVADLFASSAAFAWLIARMEGTLRNKILNGPTGLRQAYLRGILAAEGNLNFESKSVRVEMVDEKEISYIFEIIQKLGLNHAKLNSYQKRHRQVISIQRKTDLEKLQNMGGFGLQSEKNQLLKQLLDSYEEKRLPTPMRKSQVLGQVRSAGSTSINNIARTLDLSQERVRQLLYKLVDEKKLIVNKENRPYIFSLKG